MGPALRAVVRPASAALAASSSATPIADHRGAAPGAGRAGLLPSRSSATRRSRTQPLRDYWDLSKLRPYARPYFKRMLPAWDGGAVAIDGTVAEGDEVAGFEVIELPGHAPGLIGLFRESDRLALVSDTVYTLDIQTGRKGGPRVPASRRSTPTSSRRAPRSASSPRSSPTVAWAGHADPVTGDVAPAARAGGRRRPDGAARARAGQAGARSARRVTEYRDADGNVLALRGSLTPGDAARVRRDARRRPAPRGRPGSAPSSCCSSGWRCRGRSRGSRPRARRSCSARYRMATAAEREFVRDVAARRTWPRTSPSSRRRDDAVPDPDAFAALLCDWCDGASRPATASASSPPPWPRDLAAALHRAVLERDAWPYVALEPPRPGRRPLPPRPRPATAPSRRRLDLAVVGRARRVRSRSRPRPTPPSWPASTRRVVAAVADRPAAVPGGVARAALVAARSCPTPALAQQAQMSDGGVRGVRHPGAASSTGPTRSQAWRELSATPGGAGRRG